MKFAIFLASALTAFALDFPLSLATAPDGTVVVLSGGAKPSIGIVNGVELPLEDAGLGLAFAPNGKNVYVGGGARGSVYEFSYMPPGTLKLVREMKASESATPFIGDVVLSPDGRLIYAADLYANTIVVINPQSARVIDRFKTGRRPYRILFHPDGRSYFVSSWADAAVVQYSTINGEEIARLRLGPHPTGMAISAYKPTPEEGQEAAPWRYRLFVAAANTNYVYVAGIGENKTMNLLDTINLSPTPLSPLGMTPSALVLSADQKALYVACSDADAVAVVNVSDVRGVVEGFIPTGAYPTALQAAGDRLWVASGRANTVAELAPTMRPRPMTDESAAPAPPADRAIIYVIRDTAPEPLMRAIAGIAPDFTVKLGRRPNFNLADPTNTPLAGYVWTNALAAGSTVRNYGVFLRNGQAIDPALRPFTRPDVAAFLEDLKQFETSGSIPRLILLQVADDATFNTVKTAMAKSRFAEKTEIITGNLRLVEARLGLHPMTRKD